MQVEGRGVMCDLKAARALVHTAELIPDGSACALALPIVAKG